MILHTTLCIWDQYPYARVNRPLGLKREEGGYSDTFMRLSESSFGDGDEI